MIKIKVLLAATLFPIMMFAWGKEGHQIVALLAKKQLSDSVKIKVEKYLNGLSFEDASTWMDDIKKDKSLDYMKPWHYINVEKDGTFKTDTTGDIVKELNFVIEKLKGYKTLSDAEVNNYIKILFHLCGDIVQPLHVGYGNDKGGNDIKLDYKGKQSNLHRVWDSEIIQSENITYEKCVTQLLTLSDKKKSKLKEINTKDWMSDSRKLLSKVYKFDGKKIEDSYVVKNKDVIEMQLVKGGIRLSAVLNEIFK
jgi:hypothetical protein